MEFLKEILGDDLFSQVQEKVNAYNGDEANKEKQIKIGNLGSGQYVSKDKYGSKETELASKVAELTEANKLIEELKKGTKNNEDLQNKISDYDGQIAELQKQLIDTQVKAAVKVALISEKALDVDYLTYKLNEKMNESGEFLELDENGNIKGWKDKIEGLKIQFPTQFETPSKKVVEEHKLPEGDKEDMQQITNMSDALKEHYETKG